MRGDQPMNEPEQLIVADLDAAATEAAERIAAVLAEAASEGRRADWATTGGSTAPAIYRRLASRPLRDTIPWQGVHVWWGDDRYVPRDDPLSNVRPFDEIMLANASTPGGPLGVAAAGLPGPVPLPIDNLHPFPTTIAIGGRHGADWCAARLAAELREAGLDQVEGWPIFDLVILGLGDDGHLLSVFPGSAAFESRELTLAIPAPTHIEPYVERVTLNPAILGVARHVLVIVSGSSKAPVMASIFGSEHDPGRWPAQLVRRAGVTWIVDAAAAADLRH